MTEQADSNPPSIVVEVPVGEAVWALTEQNAIFRNGRQVVIPHLGVDFMAELLAALSTPEFVSGLNDNRIRMAEVENPVGRDSDPMEELTKGGWNDEPALANWSDEGPKCGAIDDDLMKVCLLEDGHEGPHTASDGSGHQWPNHRVKSQPVVDNSTNWEGFEVTQDDGHTAIVKHVGSDAEPWIFESVAEAEDILRPGTHRSEYRRLCAKAYIVWHAQAFPDHGFGPMDWVSWMRGDVMFDREGNRGFIAGPTDEDLVLITKQGNVIALEAQNDEVLSTWRVGISASHPIDPEVSA